MAKFGGVGFDCWSRPDGGVEGVCVSVGGDNVSVVPLEDVPRLIVWLAKVLAEDVDWDDVSGLDVGRRAESSR